MMTFKMHDHIDDETKRKLKVSGVHRPKKKGRVKDKLTQRDIEELMGTRRDTYKRSNGRVKRK